MKFSCDACGAQYQISDEKLGVRGVKVRCKRCEHMLIVRPSGRVEHEMSAPKGTVPNQPIPSQPPNRAALSEAVENAMHTTAPDDPVHSPKVNDGSDVERTMAMHGAGSVELGDDEARGSNADETAPSADRDDGALADGAVSESEGIGSGPSGGRFVEDEATLHSVADLVADYRPDPVVMPTDEKIPGKPVADTNGPGNTSTRGSPPGADRRSGARAPSVPGARAPSVSGARAPSVSGARTPSVPGRNSPSPSTDSGLDSLFPGVESSDPDVPVTNGTSALETAIAGTKSALETPIAGTKSALETAIAGTKSALDSPMAGVKSVVDASAGIDSTLDTTTGGKKKKRKKRPTTIVKGPFGEVKGPFGKVKEPFAEKVSTDEGSSPHGPSSSADGAADLSAGVTTTSSLSVRNGESAEEEIGSAFEAMFAEPPSEKKAQRASPVVSDRWQWFVAIRNQQVGPLTFDEVHEKWSSGQLTGKSLCWRQGMADWAPIERVSELNELLQSAADSQEPFPPIDGKPPMAPPADRALSLSDVSKQVEAAPAIKLDKTEEERSSRPATPEQGVSGWRPSAASALASLAQEELKSDDFSRSKAISSTTGTMTAIPMASNELSNLIAGGDKATDGTASMFGVAERSASRMKSLPRRADIMSTTPLSDPVQGWDFTRNRWVIVVPITLLLLIIGGWWFLSDSSTDRAELTQEAPNSLTSRVSADGKMRAGSTGPDGSALALTNSSGADDSALTAPAVASQRTNDGDSGGAVATTSSALTSTAAATRSAGIPSRASRQERSDDNKLPRQVVRNTEQVASGTFRNQDGTRQSTEQRRATRGQTGERRLSRKPNGGGDRRSARKEADDRRLARERAAERREVRERREARELEARRAEALRRAEERRVARERRRRIEGRRTSSSPNPSEDLLAAAGRSSRASPSIRQSLPAQLDETEVFRVLRRRKQEVRDCLERHSRSGGTKGRVRVTMTILPSGRVSGTSFRPASIGRQTLGQCLSQRARSWRFPRFSGSPTPVGFPVTAK
ncbi:MAG: zinc-ribbon domain-containing protein [Myxococcales bacterium]|nr:zinc-ribbon domain-containing protein [Myxococcales bacterium]